MEINGAASNGFLGENNAIGMEDHKTFDDIQNFMAESVMLEPKSAAALCAGPMDDMGFLSDGGLGPETDVDGVHDSKQQSPSPLLEEAVKSSALDNGDIVHEHEMANVEPVEQHTMDHHNPFAQSLNAPLDLPSSVAVSGSNVFEEEDPTSPSSVSAADPVELSEEHQLGDAIAHVNGNGEHHYDEPHDTEDELLLGAGENEAAEIVPALKAELNAAELVPLKSIDEPIVNDLLGGDSIVDNKLIDRLDSFGIPEAIRRQLIEQQVSGAAMLHEQDEDDDDGQLIAEEKHSDFDGADDGAEKEDLHHEKVFDSDYATDHRSADVKQDDDAGCCEDSEEDEWDYVKVNNQQQQEQESQPAHEKQPESSTPSEEITHTVEHGNSFAPQADDDDDGSQQLLQEGDVQRVQELEQHFEREVAVNYTQDVEAPTLSREEEEDRESVEEPHVETAAVPNTSELVAADILGDNTESTVSESTKEVDDVISGGETKEVVNLLNDFKEDVSLPSTTDQQFETSCLNEENIASAVPYVPSDSVNMEASMYGGSVAEQQPLSPESPVSPVENFPAQQQQQQQQQYTHEKDLFGSDMDDTMSPTTDGEELKEKHLYETEEKSMNLQPQDGSGDYGWQLNPDAKEFVPVTGSVAGEVNVKLHENIKLRDDAIVAQSPRKGTVSSMEDVDVPAETVFQTEMDKRPHEFEEYGGDNGEIGADDSAGEHRLRSPMAVHPFDLTQFSEQTVVEQIQTSSTADITNGDYASQGNADDVLAAGPNTNGGQYGADEMELLNKVQELPTEEDATFEVGADTNGSAKEELYVEQKDTIEVSGRVGEVDDMMYHGYANQLPADEVPKSMVTDISESPEFKMLQSSIEYLTAAKSAENFSEGQIEQELSNVRKETSVLESSVYDAQPELVSTQAAPAVQQLASNEQMLQASQGYADLLGMSEPVEPPQPTMNKTEEKRDDVEVTKVPDVEKATGDVVATVAAAAVATVAVAAAATATATSKSTKPKASTTATAAKKPASSVTTKPSSAASKDSAPKTASRVGSNSTAGAARKPPVGGAETKKAPTSTAAKTASTAMNGVKERPASATSSKPSLAAKKPVADAAKTATTKTASATSSVAAARTKVTSATSSSTTKTASASSATRTAASKSVTSSSTTTSAAAGKTSSLRTSTTATTRTVTSRPSSAVSSASVPSKTTTTTTTTAKRTVAAKSSLTNGTTTTDGTSTKSTKTTTTTTGSTVPRTGITARTTGSGLAAKPSSTTVAAKKPLDVKTAAATKTSSTTASATGKTTTMRTSLAPTKATATSPSVRKQNGVPAKKPTAAVSPAAGVKKPAPITKPKALATAEQQATTTTAASPTIAAATNGTGNDVVDVVLASSPPELQPADQLLVPIPQAM